VEPVAGPEGPLLHSLARYLFEPPRSTWLVLAVLALVALVLVLFHRFVLSPTGAGRALLTGARWAEIGLLALMVLAMILLSATQILARNVFDAGFLWIDPLLRYLTLWIGFLGAARATAEGRHITIDALSRVLPPRLRRVAGRVTHLAAAGICAVLAEAAYRHLASEYAYESREFLRLPTWLLLAVIPIGFTIMTYRFLDQALLPPPESELPPEVPATMAAP
jgi:TRAP-type C4-dicarboxylate transport system permease small subunit